MKVFKLLQSNPCILSCRAVLFILIHCFPNCGQVKHLLTEMYDATIKSFSGRLLKMVNDALLPVIYLNVDGWKSAISGAKFLGER